MNYFICPFDKPLEHGRLFFDVSIEDALKVFGTTIGKSMPICCYLFPKNYDLIKYKDTFYKDLVFMRFLSAREFERYILSPGSLYDSLSF